MKRLNPYPAKHLRWSFLRKPFLDLPGNSESCQNEKPFTIFVNTQSWMFGKVLNMLLNWLPKYGYLIFKLI